MYAEYEGSAQCEPCGSGTNANADRTACDISSCKFESEAGKYSRTELAMLFDLFSAPFGAEHIK
tara:strand:+ start:570 stop:761 length:192 start_codon:yes stop_codon:yes gene_type:complete